MDKTKYQAYLKVDCWKMRRDEYLRVHGKQCELCGGQEEFIPGKVSPMEIHHLTYERLGAELDKDLIAICEKCHRAMHGLGRSTPLSRIRQYIEVQLEFGIAQEKLGLILIALDKLEARKSSAA
jgi:5-methylcytosine-specific restriction endonuclease McrA